MPKGYGTIFGRVGIILLLTGIVITLGKARGKELAKSLACLQLVPLLHLPVERRFDLRGFFNISILIL